ILKLAHVAWPAMRAQRLHARLAQRRFAAAQFFANFSGEMPSQEQHVVAAFAERRNVDGENCQSKEKIAAKLATIDGSSKIFVSSGHDPNIDRHRRASPNAINRFLF